MDIKESADYRFKINKIFSSLYIKKYNYGKNGILTKCLPKILFAGHSTIVTFLQLIDMRLILMFKTIDKVKKFKHISDY